jgi:hypothetical protein
MTREIMHKNGKTSTQIGIEVAACYSLRLRGLTHQQIVEALAERNPPIIICSKTVQRRLQSEIDMKVQPLAKEVRAMELDRLDHYLAKLDPGVEGGDPVSINTALRVGERRSKLLGLDAPTQTDTTITNVTVASGDLIALLAAAKQRELTKEAAIIEGEIIEDAGAG